MKKSVFFVLLLCLFSPTILAQGVFGVFQNSASPMNRQLGNIDPSDGSLGLLGDQTSIEAAQILMNTGATTLNVSGNLAYFIGEVSGSGISRIYTVDMTTGVTAANPALTPGYTKSNNWGVWYDEPNDVLYGLFARSGSDQEIVVINTTTGAITPHHSNAAPEGTMIASGLITGDSVGEKIFFLGDDQLFVVATNALNTGHSFETMLPATPSKIWGLEWKTGIDGDEDNPNSLLVVYEEDDVVFNRRLTQLICDECNFEDGGELFTQSVLELNNGSSIGIQSGLTAYDSTSATFFMMGAPSGQPISLFAVDISDPFSATETITVIDASMVILGATGGIEVLPGSQLSLSKSDSDSTAIPGDTISYDLDYGNATGAGPTIGLKITETVPAETTFLPASSSPGWLCAPDNTAGSSCEISPVELSPNQNATISFAVQVNEYVSAGLTEINNNATISATNSTVSPQASDTTPITAAAALAVTKSDNDLMNAIPGDTISYDIAVTNTGDRVASAMFLTETVPTNTEFVGTLAWTCLPGNNAGSTCTTSPSDIGSGSSNLTFDVRVIDSVSAGTTEITNTVTAAAANAASVQATDTTPLTSAAVLSVNKTDGDTTITPGATVVYQIDYGNNGNQDADTTTLTEVVLAETVFDPTSSDPSWVCLPDFTAGSTCSLDLDTLGGGLADSVDFALTLNNPVPGIFSQLENTVVMDANNATAVMAQDITPVDAAVGLRLVKTDGGVTAGLDKIINYTLIGFNEGNRNALNVELTETVPDNTSFYPLNSTPGWSCIPNTQAGSTCTKPLDPLVGNVGKEVVLFAVIVDSSLAPNVTELSNTAILTASNSAIDAQDTELTPVDSSIPVVAMIESFADGTEITSCSQNDFEINAIQVTIQDDNSFLIGDDDQSNYVLIDTGPDQDLQSLSCNDISGDDAAVNYLFSGGGILGETEVQLNFDEPLSDGHYVLFVCDEITDTAGNALDGDGDGFTGGDFKRQFRVELDNLFDNAYFDDCLDNSISLDNYNVLGISPGIIAADSTVDIDDSALSGSVYMNSPDGNQLGIEQCINFETSGSHTLSVSGLGVASQDGDLELFMNCAFLDGPDCNGNGSGPDYQESFVIPASTTPLWQNYQGVILLPENTNSAFCAFILDSVDDSAFELNLDRSSMIESDLIFINGFEIN